ncbi:hypothetical protein SeMB42_g03723 [Synchytrium endobioticum]|uniref:rhizopuspepsin n=1 Tax=Synchytrium endobioticum TaxID=286115 RepID=A0A507D3A6_9FUNG|nr:hypothetical protein SeLEV6574_g03510 [Synchytrium endobioticum]TPX45979.1 hypothetical protein SeLEV6574_g03518 [Synchytrium endobioticum]TPX46383.1 hypothetical protein SeMB42_g03723 [Synchytrium endobioticum]
MAHQLWLLLYLACISHACADVLTSPGISMPLGSQMHHADIGKRAHVLAGDVLDRAGTRTRMGKRAVLNRGVAMTNYFDVQYYATVYVGNPPQPFRVVVDTGSADLWIPSARCTDAQCGSHARFNESQSKSAIRRGRKFTIQYALGSAAGDLYMDRVLLNVSTGATTSVVLQVVNQTFGSVTSETYWKQYVPDGVIGFAFSNLAQSLSRTPLENLYLQKQIGWPAFGVWLQYTRTDNGTSSQGGRLTLGGIDPALYRGRMAFVPVVNPAYWSIVLDAVLWGNQSIALGDINMAVLDTGSTLIGMDPASAATLNNAIGSAAAPGNPYLYLLPCAALANMTTPFSLVFGGVTFNLAGSELAVGIDTTGKTCYSPFQSVPVPGLPSNQRLWILGAIFLRKWYTVYDYNPSYDGSAITPRVGIALAVH